MKTPITQPQILAMLKLQDEMNSIVNPDWRNAGYNWPRAIMVEAVEAIEHHGWKWWKHQVPDMPQVEMELVDIWHFALSLMMQNTDAGNADHLNDIAADIVGRVNHAYDTRHTDRNLRLVQIAINGRIRDCDSDTSLMDDLQTICGMAAGDAFNVMIFSHALSKTGMSWQDLYKTYIGKNCLNIFRQANGYKTGTYLKDWSKLPLRADLIRAAMRLDPDVMMVGNAASANLGVPQRSLEDNDHLHEILKSIDLESANIRQHLMGELQNRYAAVCRAGGGK